MVHEGKMPLEALRALRARRPLRGLRGRGLGRHSKKPLQSRNYLTGSDGRLLNDDHESIVKAVKVRRHGQ